VTTQTRPFTADELLQMPDDGFRYELVRGELRKLPLVGAEHGAVAVSIGASLSGSVEESGLGRTYAAGTGFRLAANPDTVRAPATAFVSRERVEQTGRVTGYWPGAPDLAVEVVSPNDAHTQVVEKALDWLGAGCRMVLVADPERRTITVYRSLEDIRILTERDTLEGADVVSGWKLPVAEVFG
jgi:Uma2 family endonuclease